MWRLITQLGRETRGAISVMVALLLVLLLAVAAIAIDVGAMYAERAELQNGADAAALAIAENCANGICGTSSVTAQNYADRNSKDSAADAILLSAPGASPVRVQSSSVDAASGDKSLALWFSSLLKLPDPTVVATASAGWGSPAGGPAMLPLAFAKCVIDGMIDGGVQTIPTHGSTTHPCTSTSPSGQTLPGGFSWLNTASGACETQLTIGTNVLGSTGASIPGNCSTAVLKPSLVGQTAILPLYDDKSGTGSGATYHIYGWATFRIHGWRFPGNAVNNTGPGPDCKSPCTGIIGEFISYTTLDDEFTTGGPDLGTSVVFLTE